MINRELTKREKEILGMIRPMMFQDMVDIVRKDIQQSKYNAKRELRSLRNGVATNGITNGVTNGVGMTNGVTDGVTNGRYIVNNIRDEICEVPI